MGDHRLEMNSNFEAADASETLRAKGVAVSKMSHHWQSERDPHR